MQFLLYGALILSQLGTSAKQFAMKHCGRLAPGPFNSVCINMARALICLVVSILIWIVTDGTTTTPFGHLIIVIAGIGTAFNLFTWILSSRLVSLTLIESVSMIGSLVLPLILAPYLYDGDSVSPVQWVGCLLVIASVFLFMEKGSGRGKEGTLWQKIVVVGVCAISTTLAAIFKKYYTYHIKEQGLGSIEYFTFISFVVVVAVFAVLFAVFYGKQKRESVKASNNGQASVTLPSRAVWVYVLIAAVSLYVYELFASYAAQLPSAIYYPLSKALSVGCTFLLDVIVFKDRVTLKKLIGLGIILVAVVLVNF
jgi:drug/metabolite transporter (DMT)-like permease